MPVVYRPRKEDGHAHELAIEILKQDSKGLILILYLQVIMQMVSTE